MINPCKKCIILAICKSKVSTIRCMSIYRLSHYLNCSLLDDFLSETSSLKEIREMYNIKSTTAKMPFEYTKHRRLNYK